MKKLIPFFTLALIIIAGCNSSGTSGNPKEVLTKFFTALSKKDIQEAKKYVTADSEGMINMMQMSIKNMDAPENTDQFNPDKITIGDATIEGNEAHVPVTEKSSNETVNFILQKEKGDWKVAFDLGTLARMAQEKMKEKGINGANLDSLMQKMPKDELEKAQKMMDSVASHMKEIPKDQLDKAKKMLDSLGKVNQ